MYASSYRRKPVSRKRRAVGVVGRPRSVARVRGRGGYWSDAVQGARRFMKSYVPRNTFSRFGHAAGSAAFGPLGGAVGRRVGEKVAEVAGFGEYHVSKVGDYAIKRNSLLNSQNRLDEGAQVPSFGNMGQAMLVSHREYIADIIIPSSPATFTNAGYFINPGLASTFPWLSQIAVNFDQYQILGMIFEFKSTSSDFGTTTSLGMGSVMLATDYDPTDNLYSSKLEMENSQFCTTNKPSLDVCHPIECDPSITQQGLLNVRSGSVPSGRDPRFYDHGIFQIATQGLPTGSSGQIGELWCTYQIALYKPQYGTGVGSRTDEFIWSSAQAATITAVGGTQFGTSFPAPSANSSLGCTIVSKSRLQFGSGIVPGNYYMVVYYVVGTSAALTSGLAITGSGFTVVETWNTPSGTTSPVQMATWIIQATNISFAGTGNIDISAGTMPTAPTGATLIVTMLDSEIVY